jgi:SpoVK/Ycf46/Vps4 family AAA+-type ATPase
MSRDACRESSGGSGVTLLHDLNVLLSSPVPLVVVESVDETRFLGLLRDLVRGAFGGKHRPLFRWSVTEGLRRLDIRATPQLHNADPAVVLKHIRASEGPGIYALLDFHPYLADPVNVRLLKDIAVSGRRSGRTVVLVSHALDMPPELEQLSARFTISLPEETERAMLVDDVVQNWNRKNDGRVAVDPPALDLLVKNLAGLTRADAERLAHNAVFADGAITAHDLPDVMQAKYELLNRAGVLAFEYDTASFAEVGGLANLKAWLEMRRAAIVEEVPNLDPPRGLMLIGVQGCGKSLAAKAAAGVLNVPLLRLDFASLYDKYYGETERKLRESLHQAETMSPCVVWIDELEKGIATGGADDGLSRRVLGTFLTWLAEKDRAVFVIATANDISSLPPELVRKGRFDEIFFVDLPDEATRAAILEIHLAKRDLAPADFDLALLGRQSEGFSGAELEQAIVSAMYLSTSSSEPLKTDHIAAELAGTRALAVVMREKIDALRAWAADRTVPAN